MATAGLSQKVMAVAAVWVVCVLVCVGVCVFVGVCVCVGWCVCVWCVRVGWSGVGSVGDSHPFCSSESTSMLCQSLALSRDLSVYAPDPSPTGGSRPSLEKFSHLHIHEHKSRFVQHGSGAPCFRRVAWCAS